MDQIRIKSFRKRGKNAQWKALEIDSLLFPWKDSFAMLAKIPKAQAA